MAGDKRQIAKKAQMLASKGQFDDAIEEWRKLLTDSSQDGITHNSIGDLYLKKNSRKEACAAYLKAAASFKEEGSTLKAIATYKKVIKIDPSQYEIYRFLGDLNAERGLLSSAVADYLTLSKYYLKEGKPKEALELYRKICSQDPSNYSAREKMAELCIKENLTEEAIETYLQLGRERSAQFRRDEARKAYEAVLKIDPSNREAEQYLQMPMDGGDEADGSAPASAGIQAGRSSDAPDQDRMLSEALRRMNDGEFVGSEAILTQLLNADPGNPEVCQLLARLHLKRGDHAVAMNEYQFLAGAAMRADDLDGAEKLIQEFLEVQPDSPALLELLGAVYEKKDDVTTATQHYGRAIELLLANPDPDLPGLQDELYDLIKEIAPTSPLISKFAASFGGAPAPVAEPNLEMEEILEDVASPPSSPDEELVAVDSSREEAQAVVDEEPALPVSASSPEVAEVPPPPSAPPPVSDPIVISRAPTPAPKKSAQPSMKISQVFSPPPKPAAPAPSPAPEKAPEASKPIAPPPAAEAKVEAPPKAQEEVSVPSPPPPPPPPAPKKKAPVSSTAPETQETTKPAAPAKGKEEDFDTRFILGKAYKDMGLYAEAIEELRVSVNSTKWFLDSCIQLSACLKYQGMPKRAIACLEHALGDPRGRKGEQVAMARYELGLLYEIEGALDKALKTFESIPAVNDSLQRIECLKSGKVKQSSMPERSQMEKTVSTAVMAGGESSGVKKRRISYL